MNHEKVHDLIDQLQERSKQLSNRVHIHKQLDTAGQKVAAQEDAQGDAEAISQIATDLKHSLGNE